MRRNKQDSAQFLYKLLDWLLAQICDVSLGDYEEFLKADVGYETMWFSLIENKTKP